ncbi:MAG: lysostaphin resistance A-like protein [Acidobacteriota bacterium]
MIFAPLFAPGRTVLDADFRRAGTLVAVAVGIVELIGLLLVVRSLQKEHLSLLSVVNFRLDRVRAYLGAALVALVPTLAAGWLYVRAQARAGVELGIGSMGLGAVLTWYVLTPITAAFLEETIWRGYAIPRVRGRWRGLVLTSLSFALFHGVFSPMAVAATLLQGLAWGWACQRTESTVPGMALHFLSRYLTLIPGFG